MDGKILYEVGKKCLCVFPSFLNCCNCCNFNMKNISVALDYNSLSRKQFSEPIFNEKLYPTKLHNNFIKSKIQVQYCRGSLERPNFFVIIKHFKKRIAARGSLYETNVVVWQFL